MSTNRPLLDDPPLLVLPRLAVLVGLNEAIVLQQVHYWLGRASQKGRNRLNGFTWVYNSYEEWQTNFPWWSVRTIRRTVISLEATGILVARQLNGSDRRKWYRIDYDALDLLIAGRSCGQSGQVTGPEWPADPVNVAPSYTETSPETSTEVRTSSSARKRADRVQVESAPADDGDEAW